MSAPQPISLELPLWLQLNKVSRKYMDALAARLGHLGIRRHFFLLVAIGEGKGRLSQQELADLLETDKVAMVGILDMLTKAGLVTRKSSPDDRRKHFIVLTPKAERALPEIKKTIADLNRRALAELPKTLAKAFPNALSAIKAELEKAIEESGAGTSSKPSGRSRVRKPGQPRRAAPRHQAQADVPSPTSIMRADKSRTSASGR
jgi:MarR family transcriptional regulator, transcriptional regulator for hemolysin